MTAFSHLADNLSQRRKHHLYRQRMVVDGPQQTDMLVDGKQYLVFCSNDYLSLANHPKVLKRFQRAVDIYGVGSGASHLINGHSKAHHALEEELAAFTGRQRALLFSSGYMANMGVLNGLLRKQDWLFQDKLNHASLIDGGLLSEGKFCRYRHNDLAHLEQRLQNCHLQAEEKLISSDGVFSMDGDIALLPEITSLAEKYHAWTMLDDAHGLGVLGKNGKGCLEYYAQNNGDFHSDKVQILMGTFGKAFGTAGAFVAGSETLIENLIQQSRNYIYTTALPSAVAEASRESLRIIQQESWRRDKLQQLIKQFRAAAKQLDFALADSITPIQPIIIGDSEKVVEISERLKQKGLLITAIRPPAVPQGSARLRVTLCAEHTEQQIEKLIDTLEICLK